MAVELDAVQAIAVDPVRADQQFVVVDAQCLVDRQPRELVGDDGVESVGDGRVEPDAVAHVVGDEVPLPDAADFAHVGRIDECLFGEYAAAQCERIGEIGNAVAVGVCGGLVAVGVDHVVTNVDHQPGVGLHTETNAVLQVVADHVRGDLEAGHGVNQLDEIQLRAQPVHLVPGLNLDSIAGPELGDRRRIGRVVDLDEILDRVVIDHNVPHGHVIHKREADGVFRRVVGSERSGRAGRAVVGDVVVRDVPIGDGGFFGGVDGDAASLVAQRFVEPIADGVALNPRVGDDGRRVLEVVGPFHADVDCVADKRVEGRLDRQAGRQQGIARLEDGRAVDEVVHDVERADGVLLEAERDAGADVLIDQVGVIGRFAADRQIERAAVKRSRDAGAQVGGYRCRP